MINYNIIAQIIGAIAVALMVKSYLNTKKEKYLFYQISCNIFYGLQFYLLDAFSATGICIITILKSIWFYNYEKKEKQIPFFALLLVEIVTIAFGIYVYVDFNSLLPIILSCIYSYATWQKKLKFTYLTGTGISLLWIVYYFIIGAYTSIIGGMFEFCASILGIYRLSKVDKK